MKIHAITGVRMMSEQTQIIRAKALAKTMGVSTTTLWRWRQQGVIPQPMLIGSRVVGWDKKSIDEWIENLKQSQEIK